MKRIGYPEFGDISLQIEEKVIKQGGVVRGMFIVEIKEGYESCIRNIITELTCELIPKGKGGDEIEGEKRRTSFFMGQTSPQEMHEDSLPPGVYEFPFCFYVPANCPASFSGKDFDVEWRVNAIIFAGKHLQRPDIKLFKRVFVVGKGVDEFSSLPVCKHAKNFSVEVPSAISSSSSQLPVRISFENGSTATKRVYLQLVERSVYKNSNGKSCVRSERVIGELDTKVNEDKVSLKISFDKCSRNLPKGAKRHYLCSAFHTADADVSYTLNVKYANGFMSKSDIARVSVDVFANVDKLDDYLERESPPLYSFYSDDECRAIVEAQKAIICDRMVNGSNQDIKNSNDPNYTLNWAPISCKRNSRPSIALSEISARQSVWSSSSHLSTSTSSVISSNSDFYTESTPEFPPPVYRDILASSHIYSPLTV
eukprot:Nk52_evm1s399 gene=Nk52_evmTU1s399